MSYININSFSRWIIDKSDGITKPSIEKLSESVGSWASELDAQQTFLNTFENIVVRRVNIPEDKLRFQKVLQYARSKVDFVICEKMCMIPSDMNLRIRKIKY